MAIGDLKPGFVSNVPCVIAAPLHPQVEVDMNGRILGTCRHCGVEGPVLISARDLVAELDQIRNAATRLLLARKDYTDATDVLDAEKELIKALAPYWESSLREAAVDK